MIIGVGIDVVDIARFGETLERTPALRWRLFTLAEQERPWGRTQTNRAFVIAYQLGPVLNSVASRQPTASAGG